MFVLTVKNLTKLFKKRVVVSDISLDLKEGEILGLLGPNGAGKTTTMQMLLGSLKPTSGEIKYFGEDFWNNKSLILEKISFSSTYVDMPWDLKVSEILSYTSYLYDIKNRKEKIEELIEEFKLKKILNHRIVDLSAGQKTRVNLAKSFLNDPKILLLDEPTASLDPEVANYIRKFILKCRDEKNLSVLFTSHNMTEVYELCDRIIFINKGKLVANDTPENLARSVSNCKLRLLFTKDLDIAKSVLEKNKYEVIVDHKFLEIETEESSISNILNFLAKEKLTFEEIDIIKPTLEDYFLNMASEDENETA